MEGKGSWSDVVGNLTRSVSGMNEQNFFLFFLEAFDKKALRGSGPRGPEGYLVASYIPKQPDQLT